jgi:hypothetical protein
VRLCILHDPDFHDSSHESELRVSLLSSLPARYIQIYGNNGTVKLDRLYVRNIKGTLSSHVFHLETSVETWTERVSNSKQHRTNPEPCHGMLPASVFFHDWLVGSWLEWRQWRFGGDFILTCTSIFRGDFQFPPPFVSRLTVSFNLVCWDLLSRG